MSRKLVATVISTLVALGLLVAGVVIAQGTTYYACVNNSNGTIFMIDAEDTCNPSAMKISWNQEGPPGPTGPTGPAGPPGPPGPPGPSFPHALMAPVYQCVGCDLSGADLSNQSLRFGDYSTADFSGADLRFTDLRGASLLNANLANADMSFTKLGAANFEGAILDAVVFDGADFSPSMEFHPSFGGVPEQPVRLYGVSAQGADFSGVVNLFNLTMQGDLRNTNFSGLNLQWVQLIGLLGGIDLSGSDLRRAWFDPQPWNGVTSPLDWSGEDYSGRDLCGLGIQGDWNTPFLADLSSIDLSSANLQSVNFNRVDLPGANLSGANLMGLHGQGSNYSGADLTFAIFNYDIGSIYPEIPECRGSRAATISSAVYFDWHTDLSDADLTGAMGTPRLRDVVWSNTTCPDGTNSDNNGGTCDGHWLPGPS